MGLLEKVWVSRHYLRVPFSALRMKISADEYFTFRECWAIAVSLQECCRMNKYITIDEWARVFDLWSE